MTVPADIEAKCRSIKHSVEAGRDCLESYRKDLNIKVQQVLGPEERVDPYIALLGATRNVAYTYREEAIKGTITAGKIADLVILDGNPVTVAADEIRNIKVIETIKRGKTIYKRS